MRDSGGNCLCPQAVVREAHDVIRSLTPRLDGSVSRTLRRGQPAVGASAAPTAGYQIVAGLSVPLTPAGILVAVVAPAGQRIDMPLDPSEAVRAIEALLTKLRLLKDER
jgi:hypothetical protein